MSTMDELTECRTTIGRMDTILEDLRKYGFSLVTGLLTATGLVGASNGLAALPLAAGVIMFLVLALFGIDVYYQVVLSAAVGRAMDIEAWSHDPEIRITSSVSRNATLTHSTSTVFFLYSALLVASMGLGLFGADRLVSRFVILGIAAGIFAVMLWYWLYVRAVTGLNRPRARVIGVLRVDRPATVTVIGSRFEKATRITTDIPGAAEIAVDPLPGTQRGGYLSRHRDSARVTVPRLAPAAAGIHKLTVWAGPQKLGEADALVVGAEPLAADP